MLQNKKFKTKDIISLFETEYKLTKNEMNAYYLRLLNLLKNCRQTKRKIKKNFILSRNEILTFQFQKELEVFNDDWKIVSDKINPESLNFNYYSFETCIYIIKTLEDFIKLVNKG